MVIPVVAHHVTQRGNYRQDVFFTEADRRVYRALLRESAKRHGLGVSAYCLMTNHVHLVMTPEREESLVKALGRTHLMYAQYIHRLHGRLGHLWQSRFYSCPLDNAHAHNAAAYVELNPVRAKMVKKAWDYVVQWAGPLRQVRGPFSCPRCGRVAADVGGRMENDLGSNRRVRRHARANAPAHPDRPAPRRRYLPQHDRNLPRPPCPRPSPRPPHWQHRQSAASTPHQKRQAQESLVNGYCPQLFPIHSGRISSNVTSVKKRRRPVTITASHGQ